MTNTHLPLCDCSICYRKAKEEADRAWEDMEEYNEYLFDKYVEEQKEVN